MIISVNSTKDRECYNDFLFRSIVQDNPKIQLALEISALNHQKLQFFALQRGLTLPEAIDIIVDRYLDSIERNERKNQKKEEVVEVEDEPDEILWDFLEEDTADYR